jgi:Electron transfer DM13
VVAFGFWVAAGVLTNDFTASLILSAVWMGVAGVVCLAVFLRRRDLGLPMLAGYVLVAIVATVWLGRSQLFDKTVNENVVRAAPAEARGAADAPARNVLVARGGFESLEHETGGTASLIRTRNGERVLTLTDFETDNGPDLRVYLVAGPVNDAGDVHDYADLGALKGNKGNQQYDVTGKARDERYRTVVIWCRAFSVAFGRARLADS